MAAGLVGAGHRLVVAYWLARAIGERANGGAIRRALAGSDCGRDLAVIGVICRLRMRGTACGDDRHEDGATERTPWP